MSRKAGPAKPIVTNGPGKRGSAEAAAESDAFDHWLEDKLRNAYSSVLEEPIPDELLKLLQQRLSD
ncbi:MAG TPA: NepR family anti-sigma factor [Alphaproteobacteria bacterium]|nr:NepR family anti-sigma factor [Alphaproteobacteria bacterium]